MAPSTSSHIIQAKQLFLAAADLPVEQRDSWLDDRCGEDTQLRGLVDRLLAQLDVADTGDLGAPAIPLPAFEDYEVLEELGEGGMGMVYLAEQLQPVRRRVALKLIKPGMDTREVIARFESERQTLALMNHPGIARIYDGGATPEGRPYFVMELVEGLPLSEYCDAHRLPMDERLALFRKVCDAVQHAHQKGILHRDLKPSNVLIAEVDGEAQPKVIDFGIARAMDHEREHSLVTRQDQWIGTFHYMSPEQVGRRHDDVDSRSDIYALGVMLYELLTGDLPFGRDAALAGRPDEYLRLLEERTPAEPSLRVRKDDTTQQLAADRATDQRSLARTLQGELDWIAMKALAAERESRYSSASELSADLGRFLRHEPVFAAPAGRIYHLRKFVRRNRLSVVAGTVVLLALLAGGVGTTVALFEARDQRDAATTANGALKVAKKEAEDERDAAREAERQAEEERAAARSAEARAERESESAIRERDAAKSVAGLLTDLLALVDPESADPLTLLARASTRIEKETVFVRDARAASDAHRLLGQAYTSRSEFELAFDQLLLSLARLDELEDVPQLERYEVLHALWRAASGSYQAELENTYGIQLRRVAIDLFHQDQVELTAAIRANHPMRIAEVSERDLDPEDERWVAVGDRVLEHAVSIESVEEALEIFERIGIPPAHPRVQMALDQGARLHYFAGRFEECSRWASRLDRALQRLPEGHYRRPWSDQWAGAAACALGDFERGIPLLEKAADPLLWSNPAGGYYPLHFLIRAHRERGHEAEARAAAADLAERLRSGFRFGVEAEVVATVLGPEHSDLTRLIEEFCRTCRDEIRRSESPPVRMLSSPDRRWNGLVREWRARFSAADAESYVIALRLRQAVQDLGNVRPSDRWNSLAEDVVTRCLEVAGRGTALAPNLHCWLVNLCVRSGQLERAVRVAREALRSPMSPRDLTNVESSLAQALWYAGHPCAPEMAVSAYRETRRLLGEGNGNTVADFEIAVKGLTEAGRTEVLDELFHERFRRLLRQSGDPSELWVTAFLAGMIDGLSRETRLLAREAVEKAARLKPAPTHPNPIRESSAGATYSRLGDHEAAVATLRHFSLVPVAEWKGQGGNPLAAACVAHLFLAVSTAELGDQNAALAALERGRALMDIPAMSADERDARWVSIVVGDLLRHAERVVLEGESGASGRR